MKPIFNIYKPIGATPLEIIKKIKTIYHEYHDEPIGYAGRLDPLAHGVLLLMIGEANKQREKYLSLSKEYIFEGIFGIETDTHDVMGIMQKNEIQNIPQLNNKLATLTSKMTGRREQQYPIFSSKTVQGKPLFWWAKQNKLSKITIPKKDIIIERFSLIKSGTIKKEKLKRKILTSIKLVHGDFRQKQILDQWKQFFQKDKTKIFQTATFSIRCSSGTYVRSLMHTIGKELGTGAITIDIQRTKVGDYDLKNSTRLQ